MSVFVYWILLLFPSFCSLLGRQATLAKLHNIGWALVGLVMVLIIGLRYQVGGDWFSYFDYYKLAEEVDFWQALGILDSGYMAVNWLSSSLGGGIYSANTLLAAITVLGVMALSGRQPYPWLALTSAVPYLLVVVGMGYTRQAVAIGLGCIAMIALAEGKGVRAMLLIFMASFFHKTAVVLLPLVLLAYPRLGVLKPVSVAGLTFFALHMLFNEVWQSMWQVYVDQQMESAGGEVRAFMVALPALCLLIFRHQLLSYWPGKRLWTALALIALSAPWFVVNYSTLVDRLLLYVAPMTLVFYGRLPLLWRNGALRAAAVVAIVFLHAATLWVWLNYAAHADSWLPYRMYPWID